MIIAIIPARGGSKGIRRKNVRLLNDKPLLSYVIEKALKTAYIDRVIVTTDDAEIKKIAEGFNVLVRMRPAELGADNIPLDPVVVDAVEWYEKTYVDRVDAVITIQPTSPLLSTSTLEAAIKEFNANDADTLISVVNATHLEWRKEGAKVVPAYRERLNRQWLPPKYKETGSFLVCKRDLLNRGKRIGETVIVFEVPQAESIDIDTPLDWLLCSQLLNRMSIRIVVTGNNQVGMGHVYRVLSLANCWLGHEIQFLLWNCSENAKKLIEDKGYQYLEVSSLVDIAKKVKEGMLIINDILDTSREYVHSLKDKGAYVVNFEDLGDGAEEANLVINALYERFNPPQTHKYGLSYVCLNEIFLLSLPNEFSTKIRSLLITFGGTDPANLTYKTLRSLENIENDFEVRLVIGPAYQWKKELERYLHEKWGNRHLVYYSNVANMAEIMKDVDLAITSNGRTIYELAAMRIPSISIAQNDRETLHLFARYSKGISYLGITGNVSMERLEIEIQKIINDHKLREVMYCSLPTEELRKGLFRTKDLIESEFWRWKNGRP